MDQKSGVALDGTVEREGGRLPSVTLTHLLPSNRIKFSLSCGFPGQVSPLSVNHAPLDPALEMAFLLQTAYFRSERVFALGMKVYKTQVQR